MSKKEVDFSTLINEKRGAHFRREIRDFFPLSAKDREILYNLSLNSRMNFTHLAELSGLSKQVVSYRIKQMENRGVIRGYQAIPNVALLGKTHYRVFIKYGSLDDATEMKLVERLQAIPEVSWLTLLSGDFDLEFVVWADNVLAFERVYDGIMAEFGGHFHEKYFSLGTRVEYLPLRFLRDEESPAPSMIFGGDFDRRELRPWEKSLLLHLNRNGRLSYRELAKMCSLSEKAVKEGIETLTESGILLGFGIKINPGLIGYTYRKVFLQLSDPSPKTVELLAETLRREKSVLFLVKTIGPYDFEFELLTENDDEFRQFMRRFRAKFSQKLKAFQTVISYDELKFGELSF